MLTANLCGVNQKLIVEALASVRRGVKEKEPRDSPLIPLGLCSPYKIDVIHEDNGRFHFDQGTGSEVMVCE